MSDSKFKLTQHPEEEDDLSAFWLITYSDMTTLLLAFFLLIYAFTVMGDSGRESLIDALNLIDENAKVEELEEPLSQLKAKADKIAEMMGEAPGEEQPWVHSTESEVTIGLPASITFSSGSAKLNPIANKYLRQAVAILHGPKQLIRIEGHTDDRPLFGGGPHASNWHLSVARAQTVVKLFIEEGVSPRHIEVVGYADTRPRDTNDTPQGRSANRRIEIKLLSGAQTEKPPAPDPAANQEPTPAPTPVD